MPAFLTPEEFQHTAAARKPGASYSGYKTWVTKTRAKRAAGQGKPSGAGIQGGQQVLGFGQTDPRQILAQAQQLFRMDPSFAPLTNQQITSQAQNIVNPLFQSAMDQISGAIGKRTEQGRNAIAGYGADYLASLPAIQSQVAGIYDQAKGEQSSVNATLANFIRDQGAKATDSIAAANAQAGGTGGGIAPTAALGAGASAANLAYGGSTLENLISQGAAENAYTAQLPAFARAQQTQTLGNFLAGQQSSLDTQMGSLQQQLPQTISDTYQSLLNRELTKAQGRTTAQGQIADYYSQGLTRNSENAALGAQLQQSATSNEQFNKNLTFQQQQEQHRQQEAAANLQWEKTSFAKSLAAKNDPKAGQTLSQRLQAMAPELASMVQKLRAPTTGPGGVVTAQGLSFGKIRGRVAAFIKAQLGPVPAKILKQYVDLALQANGWQPAPAGYAGGQQVMDPFTAYLQGGGFYGNPAIGAQAGGSLGGSVGVSPGLNAIKGVNWPSPNSILFG